MKKTLLISAAAATLAAGAVLSNDIGASATTQQTTRTWPTVAGSATASATAAPAITSGRTIRLVGHQVRNRNVNVPPDSYGPGDYNLLEETLRDSSGNVVGRDGVQCTSLFTLYRCSGTFVLYGKGSVEISGSITRSNNLLAVTGGTGNFQNVRGQLLVRSGSGTDTPLTLYLLP